MENEKKIEEKVQVLVAKKIPDLELPSVLEVRPRSKLDMLISHKRDCMIQLYMLLLIHCIIPETRHYMN